MTRSVPLTIWVNVFKFCCHWTDDSVRSCAFLDFFLFPYMTVCTFVYLSTRTSLKMSEKNSQFKDLQKKKKTLNNYSLRPFLKITKNSMEKTKVWGVTHDFCIVLCAIYFTWNNKWNSVHVSHSFVKDYPWKTKMQHCSAKQKILTFFLNEPKTKTVCISRHNLD